MTLAGRTRTMTARITEPSPGHELVETSDTVRTVFTVTPEGAGSRVRFDTTLEGSGFEGVMNRLFAGRLLSPVYADELARLERYAQALATSASTESGRSSVLC